jgi:hypothetical protein
MEPAASAIDLVRPWRRATILASSVAALEFAVLLIVVAVALAKPLERHARKAAVAQAVSSLPAPSHRITAAPGKPRLTRAQTDVLVLNGNGRTGAAATEAIQVHRRGYMVAGTGNASRTDYVRSVVMYRSGFRAEAARLAHDLGIRTYGPLDGLRVRDLLGAHLALIVGD